MGLQVLGKKGIILFKEGHQNQPNLDKGTELDAGLGLLNPEIKP